MTHPLCEELAKPEYAGLSDAEATALLRAEDRQVLTLGSMVNERQIVAAFANPADGEAFLLKLAEKGKTNPLLSRALGWLKPEAGGLDAGHPQTQAILDSFVGQAGITAEEVATVKALGFRTVSRLEELGLPQYDIGDVTRARSMM